MHQITVFLLRAQDGTTETVFSTLKINLAPTPSLNGDRSMKRSKLMFLGLALLCTVTLPLQAQNGCVTSPENPTAILAVIGSAGAFFTTARARIKARRRSAK
jgi:XrtJ-associated TM-motif-TM protein